MCFNQNLTPFPGPAQLSIACNTETQGDVAYVINFTRLFPFFVCTQGEPGNQANQNQWFNNGVKSAYPVLTNITSIETGQHTKFHSLQVTATNDDLIGSIS